MDKISSDYQEINGAFYYKQHDFCLYYNQQKAAFYLDVFILYRVVSRSVIEEIDQATFERYLEDPQAALPQVERMRKQEEQKVDDELAKLIPEIKK